MDINTPHKPFSISWQTIFSQSAPVVALILVLGTFGACRSVSETKPQSVSPKTASFSAIESIGNQYPQMNVGVSVVSVKDKKSVATFNDKKLFVPASTAKLLTFAAALHYLGPQFRYDTELYTQKRSAASINNLFLKGSGDPSFSSTDIYKLVGELKQLGVKQVAGDIVVDATIFDDVSYANGWMVNDLDEGYSAPVSGISVDHNRVAFGFFASAHLKEKIRCTVFPQTNYFKVDNHAVTGNANSSSNLKLAIYPSKTHPMLSVASGGITRDSRVAISGKTPALAKVRYETLAIQNPREFAGFLIKEALAKQGITFKGKIRFDVVPEKAELLTHHLSVPLSEMIIDFVKMSNNHASESLLKTISAVQFGSPGTFDKGLLAVKDFLKNTAGMSVDGLVTADGSGLSRYNQISASQLTDLLTYMWNNFEIGPEFITSLAIFGSDGTLKKSGDASLNKNVRAKTGTMRNLRSLAGYMKLDSGEVVAFAVLTNGTDSSPNSQKRAIEDILISFRGKVAQSNPLQKLQSGN